MALIKCPECGREVSDATVACPGCGYPIADGAVGSGEKTPEPSRPTKPTNKDLRSGDPVPNERDLYKIHPRTLAGDDSPIEGPRRRKPRWFLLPVLCLIVAGAVGFIVLSQQGPPAPILERAGCSQKDPPSSDRSGPRWNCSGVDLTGLDLSPQAGVFLFEANFEGAVLKGAVLTGANLRGADLRFADLTGANLHGANLEGANLTGVDLQGVDFSGVRLGERNLVSLISRGADLRGASLIAETDSKGVNLQGVNLEGAILGSEDVFGPAALRSKLERANLQGANLRGVNIARGFLTYADLAGADLEGANLNKARLVGANLEGANLEGARLEGANLEGANLEGANLEGANLTGANVKGANFKGAYLTNSLQGGLQYDKKTIWMDGSTRTPPATTTTLPPTTSRTAESDSSDRGSTGTRASGDSRNEGLIDSCTGVGVLTCRMKDGNVVTCLHLGFVGKAVCPGYGEVQLG